MKILPLLTVENNRSELEKISLEVPSAFIDTQEFQTFLNDLIYTAKTTVTAEGWEAAGLAAVQVGKLLRVFVVRDFKNDRFLEFINPTIEFLGTATDCRPESCLSIPSVIGEVSRHKRVRVFYTDKKGIRQKQEYDGFLGRAIQHEYDHLDGVLFTTKVV